MSSEYIINICHLKKSFKDNSILQDIHLKCRKGEIYGIVGHNGSGKSVLFKCLCGFLNYESGKIFVNGKDVKINRNSGVNWGIIIEEPAFLDNYSGIKNLEFLFRINNKKNTAQLKYILKLVGLDPNSRKPVGKYSLGMKQRLAIAQAIMEDQDILILDEPMNGLDKAGIMDIRNLLLRLKKEGKTILLASHSKEDIDTLCGEVYSIESGILHRFQ